METWKPVVAVPEYEVSDQGRLRSSRTHARWSKGLRSGWVGRNGYRYFRLSGRSCLAHRLVAEAFLPAPAHPAAVVRHLNGDPLDNRADNLAWGTPRDNAQDTVAMGRSTKGERNPRAKLSWVQVRQARQWLAEGVKGREIAARLGVRPSMVSRIKNNSHWVE